MKFKTASAINELLIDDSCKKMLYDIDFLNNNTLLIGRAGVGKTLICKIVKSLNPNINYIEDICYDFEPTKPTIATSNNLNLKNKNFDHIIEIKPLNKIVLLKRLSFFLKDFEFNNKTTLLSCIDRKYPNVNKILTLYFNENSILL